MGHFSEMVAPGPEEYAGIISWDTGKPRFDTEPSHTLKHQEHRSNLKDC